MAAIAAQLAPGDTLRQVMNPPANLATPSKHHVVTQLNYHKVPADGSLPRPVVVGSVSLVCL
jgi:hypothetical protein